MVILSKARLLGFSDQLLNWIQAFLVDRVMAVSVSGYSSGYDWVTSGVLQETVLLPVLFFLYVNFIAMGVSCS